MKNAFRKLIPALIMVIVSALFVGTSTYAWFSMNKKVTVTGMSVKTQVSDSLAIASTNETAGVVDAQYSNYLVEPVSGSLRPTSSVDGLNFWYTDPLNVLGNGNAIDDVYTKYSEAGVEQEGHAVDTNITNDANYLNNPDAGKTHYDEEFQRAFENVVDTSDPSTVIYGYIDYTFYIKATNSKADAQNIVLEYCNLLYNGSPLVDRAWRVAVFSHNTTRNNNYDDEVKASDFKAILTFADAHNFDEGKAISGNTAPTTVSYNTSTTWAVASVGATSTEYKKVTVRLWLEGEDTTCRNDTFVKLTGDYTLDLAFAFGTNTATKNINTDLIVAEEGDENTNTITVKLYDQDRVSNMQFPRSYQWYNEDGIIDGATDRTYTIPYASDKKVYCVVTTDHGPYRTALYLYNPATTKTGTNYVTVKLDGEGKLDNGQTPATYKWYKDGVETSFATGDFVITDASDNGTYYCVITVGTGEDEVTYQTKKVDLTFTAPTAELNAYGTGATVALHNNETSATYQWYDGSNTAVDGATSATFAITSQSDNGYYYCKVTARGTYNTLPVMLNCTPEVTVEGTDTATVTVTDGKLSNGETPTSYQWYDNTDTEVVGETAATFTATADGDYYCIITTASGDYTTATVNLTVTP